METLLLPVLRSARGRSEAGPGTVNVPPAADRDSQERETDCPATVILDRRQPRRVFHEELGRKVAGSGRVFNYAGTVFTDLGGKFAAVESASVMGSFCGDIVDIVKLTANGPEYVDLPTADARYLVSSAEQKARLPLVEFYSDVPVLDDSWQVTVPRHNPRGNIYYEGQRITPASGLELLPQLLDAIHFKRGVDRTNYLAFLLTPFAGARLAGQRPIALLKGNQPGIGKSTAAQVAAALATKTGAFSSVTYTRNDLEFEKAIGACVLRGTNLILIDNISIPANVAIRSAALERTVTMPEYNFRRIGTSQQIRGRNFLQFWATYNGGTIGTDLASRCIAILMHYGGDVAEMPSPPMGDLLRFTVEHRERLTAELLYLWETWRNAGRRQISTPCRFHEWASLMNGVLTANGYRDFLSTYEADRGEADEIQIALEELAAERPDRFLSAGNWRREAEKLGVLTSMLAGHTDRSKDTKMGTVLHGSVGRRIRQLDEAGNVLSTYVLQSRPARDGVEYGFQRPPLAEQQ